MNNKYTSEEYLSAALNMISFADSSPEAFHAAANITSCLKERGYTELFESEKWEIEAGGKYYVTRNLSSVIAFKVNSPKPRGFMICAVHCDSPAFKLKPGFADSTGGLYTRLNVEKYGGMALYTWLDRPLSIAGRLICETENGIETRLTDMGRDYCVIPSLAIHMNPDTNKGFSPNPQTDMLPIIGDAAAAERCMKELAERAEVDEKSILGFDLFLYNRQRGTIWGADSEYFSAPRIDDLQCVYAALSALLECRATDAVQVMAVFDNEEVGSGTKQGARSTFLRDVIERASAALGVSGDELYRMLADSMMISADNGHAVHPNHPEKADPINRPHMNGGVVIKHNANQRYTTDGVSAAIFKKILNTAGIPYQEYVNRSDIAGGSTLGNIASEKVSINTVDIGAAQLSMHSSYETGGTHDTLYLTEAMRGFFETELKAIGGGGFKIEGI